MIAASEARPTLHKLESENHLIRLAQSLLLAPNHPWAMLSAYFDESGTHDSPKVFVVAGLISPVSQWQKLTGKWQRALNQESLRDFHMVDCCHGVGRLKGWDKERRTAILKQLIGVIRKHVCWRTWTAVALHDYFRLFPSDDWKKADNQLYSICAMGCASRIKHLVQTETSRSHIFSIKAERVVLAPLLCFKS